MFTGEPVLRELDDEAFVDLIFHAEHPPGGRSQAAVLMRRTLVDEAWAISRARAIATEACARLGAGDTAFVYVSTALSG